jgi:Tol biopolymer transport system component
VRRRAAAVLVLLWAQTASADEIWFVGERDGGLRTFAVRPDGSGLREVDGDGVLENLAAGGGMARMAIDARGRFAVLESDRASFRDLWRFDLRSGAATRLTDAPAGNFEPALSPDGRQVVFASSRDGDAEIYVMPAAGGRARRLTFFHRDDWNPVWSPDGRRIAFVSDREGRPCIFVVRADGTGLRRLTRAGAGEEGRPAWSPDGRHIAYTIAAGAIHQVAIADAATGRTRIVTPAGTSESDPAWSPDGRHLVIARDHDGDSDLWLVPADGRGASTRLTRGQGNDFRPRWRAGR